MTTNGSSQDGGDKPPQAERVEVRRVEADGDGGRRRAHPAYVLRRRPGRLRLGWRVWLALAILALVVVGLVALAVTVLIWILPWLILFVAAMMLARWIQRLLGARR